MKKRNIIIPNQTKTTLQVKVVTLFKKDACYRYIGMFFVVKAKHFISKINLKAYFRNKLFYVTVH